MTDETSNAGNPAGEMAEYLQTFLDETEEQLDDLVETMLALESDTTRQDDLNEAFRLIHSIKGSAGIMGFDNITVLTHHLENRFERFRSGLARLDETTMSLVLRCIDFLRQCTSRLREGQHLACATELLDELRRLEEQGETSENDGPQTVPKASPKTVPQEPKAIPSELPVEGNDNDSSIRMIVKFRPGLQLADLKAQLIVVRLAELGEIKSTDPAQHRLADIEQLDEFTVVLDTDADQDRLRAAADVDGVEAVQFGELSVDAVAEPVENKPSPQEVLAGPPVSPDDTPPGDKVSEAPPVIHADPTPIEATVDQHQSRGESLSEAENPALATPPQQTTPDSGPAVAEPITAKVAETMRVDIDRLDNLMNLAGELVVNRARFVQISGQISPALRKASMLDRTRDFSDGLRRTIESMEDIDRREWSLVGADSAVASRVGTDGGAV